MERQHNKSSVFIIHGHDTANANALKNFLKNKLSLDPIILRDKPHCGRTLIEKFEEVASSTSYAFAIMTPDEPIKNTDAHSLISNSPKKKELILDLGGVEMKTVLVEAGEFMMGADNENPNEEKPAHKVKISKPFYIGKYQVTVAQFGAFVKATKYQTVAEKAGNKGWGRNNGDFEEMTGINWKTPNFPQEDKHPVCLITWNDAQEFCKWATKDTGHIVRLPTEAEWEYACRAGTTTRFNTGNTDSDMDQAGWSRKNSSKKTHPVGQKDPNDWGLHDMHGNVWQ